MKTLTVVKLNEDDLTEAVGLFLEAKGVMIADADVSFMVDGKDLEELEARAIMGAETAMGRKKGTPRKGKPKPKPKAAGRMEPGGIEKLAKAILRSVPKTKPAKVTEMALETKFHKTRGQIARALKFLVDKGQVKTMGTARGTRYRRV